MKNLLFILACILFFAGFLPKGWEIFACILLAVLFSVPVITAGLSKNYSRFSFLISAVFSMFYGVFVFSTADERFRDQQLLVLSLTVLTCLGSFWFVLNVISTLPKIFNIQREKYEPKSDRVGKPAYIYILIISILNVGLLSQSSPLYPIPYNVSPTATVSIHCVSGSLIK